MTIPEVVTIEQALSHLRLPSGSVDTDDLQIKIDAATQLVCEYVADRQPADEDWIETIEGWGRRVDPPALIVAAVLQQVAELFRFRGDDLANDAPPSVAAGCLSPIVARLLARYRSPVIA